MTTTTARAENHLQVSYDTNGLPDIDEDVYAAFDIEFALPQRRAVVAAPAPKAPKTPKTPRYVRPTGPQPMYRPTDTFEQKVDIAERFLAGDICDAARDILRLQRDPRLFLQKGAIAYELYLSRKGR